VLCEKPLARSAAQAREMYDAAERNRVKHMTYFTWRWLPHYRHLRALAAAGYVGQPYFVDLRFRDGGAREGRYAWRYDADRASGVLGDIGPHAVDLAQWLLGEIVAVQAQMGTFVRRPGSEGAGALEHPASDDAHLLVRFANGAQGTVHVTGLALQKGFQQYVAVHGAAGALEAAFPWPAEPAWPLRGGRHPEGALAPLALPDDLFAGMDRSQPWPAQFAALFQSQPVGDRLFVEAILHDRAIEPSFYDGWKAQEILEAALQSERTGQRVSIEAATADRDNSDAAKRPPSSAADPS
jgi:predicted dehydrogenase